MPRGAAPVGLFHESPHMMNRTRILALLLSIVSGVVVVPVASAQADVAKALTDLDAADYQVRIDAAKSLSSAGKSKPIVQALLRHLTDPDWGVQIACLDALGALADPESTMPVAEKVIEGDICFVRKAALAAVTGLDRNKAIGYFVKVARTGKTEARVRAIRALAEFQDDRLIPELLALVKEKDAWVRGDAAVVLGNQAKGKQGLALLDALKNKGFAGQYGALQGLAGWSPRDDKDGRRGVEAIVGFLSVNRPAYVLRRARDLFGGLDPKLLLEVVRAEFARADLDGKVFLARFAAEMRLREFSAEARVLAKDRDEKARAAGAFALGPLGGGAGDTATLDTLRALLKDPSPLVQSAAYGAYHGFLGERLPAASIKDAPPDVRLAAVSDLGREKTAEAADFAVVSALLEDPDWRVACAAAISLGRQFQERALDPLAKLLKHSDWRIRGGAVVAVGTVLRKEAVPLLMDKLGDKDLIVQGAALKNLQYMTRQTFDLDPAAWKDWWAKAEPGFTPFNPGDVIQGLRASGYGTDDYVYKLFQNMEIIVVSGSWDHVEEVLKDLKLKHQVISPSELTKIRLNPRQILLLNCGSQVGGKNAEVLLWFVATGGYLMSTDWVIQDTLERIWPQYLQGYKKDATNDDVVVTEPCSGDRLMQDVYAAHARTKIWLEITSFGVQVNNPYGVTVLVDSLEMMQKYSLDAACVAFPFGHGKIFHSMSHFYLQKQSLQNVRTRQELKIFAVDHLGLDVDGVRKLEDLGDLDAPGKEPLSRLYPVFKVIVNFVDERLKRDLGED